MWGWLKSNHHSVTALTAILVSVVALFVAWDQSRVMRAQQHGALIPIVELGRTLSNDDSGVSVEINIFNEGVGPAFVENVSLMRNGVVVTSAAELVAALPPTTGRSWGHANGMTLGIDESSRLLTLSWAAGEIDTEAFYQMIEDLDEWQVVACYCSVFGRCWLTSMGEGRATRISRCRPEDVDPFEAMANG